MAVVVAVVVAEVVVVVVQARQTDATDAYKLCNKIVVVNDTSKSRIYAS